uniref:Protein AAR2 homolog n=1 Tax=Syphacia muris TaxID=451379 RepID=A0A0N5AFC5_9BILA
MDSAVSAAAAICNTATSDMPQEIALCLFENGAFFLSLFILFLGVPRGIEFGIDYKSWTVDSQFRGLKMIPPGVHFIYFSVKTAPRIGFFHHFKEKEILIRKWNPSTESMTADNTTEEDISRIRANLKLMDRNLAPYPYENYRDWFALSNYITEKSIARIRPENEFGQISGQAELVTMETELMENDNYAGSSLSRVDREHPTRIRFVDEQGLPIMRIKPGHQIRFQDIQIMPVIESCVYMISKLFLRFLKKISKRRNQKGIDRSDDLEKLISDFSGDWKEVFAELQLAFVCFLLGQVYEGFEQWKRLIYLLCSCTTAIDKRSDMYLALLAVVHFQLKECPEDFFVDIVSKDNFLTTTLSSLFGNIEDSSTENNALKEKSRKFKNYLTKRFKWCFD